jgi:ribosome biogenesis GTPase / thiamine phosphate phosphatase
LTNAPSLSALELLGWSDFFADQVKPTEADLAPRRIASVHRARIEAIDVNGPVRLELPSDANTADFAVGDWVLAEPRSDMLVRRLERKSVFQRRPEVGRMQQLVAANIDTLLIVASCNADFNIERLERYLIMTYQAGSKPVIVLTKADTAADVDNFHAQAEALQPGLPVIALNGRSADASSLLKSWCGVGQTVALVGSSGVGKSTLVNTLTASDSKQKTGSIREYDAQGRHTTTARSLHAIPDGGWVIDTPGIRTLYVSDVTDGIDLLFADITELAPHCRFRDCTHVHEPGCAVQAAVKNGTLDADRVGRWRTLVSENRDRTPVISGPRGNKIARKRK